MNPLSLTACAAVLALLSTGCPEEQLVDATCVSSESCAGDSFCFQSQCLEPNEDLDGDSLSNGVEAQYGMRPDRPDTDGDGVPDDVEFGGGTAPLDRDGDGKIDALEPDDQDVDCDGIADVEDADDGPPEDCLVVDPCLVDNGGCQQTCVAAGDVAVCDCTAGWSLAFDGASCEDIDECAVDTGGCDQQCTNVEGSFSCGCAPGWRLGADGVSCEDVDECLDTNGGCDQICTNTAGSSECACESGWELSDDGRSCLDIDECGLGISGCAQQCVNQMGGFECRCEVGWSLAGDGLACELGCIESPVNGHCYTRMPGPVSSWQEAQALAWGTTLNGLRAHLVTINDTEEYEWLQTEIGLDDVWLGAYRDVWEPSYSATEGAWYWVTGEPFDPGVWGDVLDELPGGPGFLGTESAGIPLKLEASTADLANKGFLIEFEDAAAITYVGQDQENIVRYRTPTLPHLHAPEPEGYYGTEGTVLFASHSPDYSGGGSIIPGDPLTLNDGTFETLVLLPEYLTLESNGQDAVAAGFGSAEFDDPRLPPGSSGPGVRAGLGLNNNVAQGTYRTTVDITIASTPPPVIRMGIIMRGQAVDAMAATKVERVQGGPYSRVVAVRVGDPGFFMHVYELVGPVAGERYRLSIVNVTGNNPNVSYFGLTFD